MEFAVGRASQKSPVKAYQALEKPGQKWHIHGYITVIGCYLLMMFYTTVSGWMLHYFYLTATGKFTGLDADQVGGVFNEMLSQPLVMAFWMIVVVAIGIFVCSRGLQNGLEKITKVMMIALLAIMVVLAINSIMMDGAAEGLKFYLIPDFERMKELGIGYTIVTAMNQAFFTLSLGIGAMAIFGSYIGKERSLLGESANIAILDTFVAIVSGLIIFPACFTFGVSPTSGPSLIFITLPNIFNHIPMGRLWGSLFFIFMTFAAFSTVLAVFENIISCMMELTGWSRKKSSLVNLFGIILLSLPCVLGYNVWSWDGFSIFGGAVLDLEDFLVSNILLPLGSLVYLLFCTSRYGNKVEVHALGERDQVVMALDGGRLAARLASAGLDDVGVDGALSQVLDRLAIGLELLRHGKELFPELRADDAALLLGLGHTSQKLGIAVLGVDVDKVDVKLLGEDLLHLLGLALAQQAVSDQRVTV